MGRSSQRSCKKYFDKKEIYKTVGWNELLTVEIRLKSVYGCLKTRTESLDFELVAH